MYQIDIKNWTIEFNFNLGAWAFPLSFELWGSQYEWKMFQGDFTIGFLFFQLDVYRNNNEKTDD